MQSLFASSIAILNFLLISFTTIQDGFSMKTKISLLTCGLLVLMFSACERPKSPNFKLDRQVQAPLTVEKTYPFLGDGDAIVDTTSPDFENLFSSDSDGLVRLTKQQDLSLGNLNDAIPSIDVDTTELTSQVGPLQLSSFTSNGTVGSAGFQSITGSPTTLQQGDPLPAGSTPSPANVTLNTDYFVSAQISRDGSLVLTATNNLGFNIDQLSIDLNSGSTQVGTATITPFDNNATETATLAIPAGTQLSDLNVDVSASWSTQTMAEDGGNFVVDNVSGSSLVASQITATLESQSFSNSGSLSINQDTFEFRSSEDFISLKSGELSIDIDNQINLGLKTLDITIPDITDPSGNPLVINMTDIPSSGQGGSYSKVVDLSGYKIQALNSIVDYQIQATTRNTQQSSGPDTRTINESDELRTIIDLDKLELARAEGYIVTNRFLLNSDATSDGVDNLELFNDNEAEITSIDGIDDISSRVTDLSFANPLLNANYETNLGVNTTVYAAIAGVDPNGNIQYLTGSSGSPYEVSPSEIPTELTANGQLLSSNQLVKFQIETAQNPSPNSGEAGSNIFNAENSNAPDFFSNLPTQIRFVGVAVVNEEQNRGTIVNPVIFDSRMDVDLPFSLSANNATFKDTVDADLSDLPGENPDESKISDAVLSLNYTNKLPIDLNLTLYMLDENGAVVAQKSNISIEAAQTNSEGFAAADSANSNKTEIGFTTAELNTLYKTRTLAIEVNLNTSGQQPVKLRADDSISLRFQIQADVTSTVN